MFIIRDLIFVLYRRLRLILLIVIREYLLFKYNLARSDHLIYQINAKLNLYSKRINTNIL